MNNFRKKSPVVQTVTSVNIFFKPLEEKKNSYFGVGYKPPVITHNAINFLDNAEPMMSIRNDFNFIK